MRAAVVGSTELGLLLDLAAADADLEAWIVAVGREVRAHCAAAELAAWRVQMLAQLDQNSAALDAGRELTRLEASVAGRMRDLVSRHTDRRIEAPS